MKFGHKMPSFCLAGRAFKSSGDELEEHELDGLALLRKFTGDSRGDVPLDRAYWQLGRLRAMRREFEEYNAAADGTLNVALAAYCRARVIELLSSVGLTSRRHAEIPARVALDDLVDVINTIETMCCAPDGRERVEASRERLGAGRIEFEDLAELYAPGLEVVGPAGGLSEEMGFLVRSCHFEETKTPFGVKLSFQLELEFFASVGDTFGAIRCQEQVGWWRGLREKDALFFRPMPAASRARLAAQGALYAEVGTGRLFLACREGGFVHGGGRATSAQSRAGRVMVDVVAAMESGHRPVLSGHADAAPGALEAQAEYYRRAQRQGRLDKKDAAVERDDEAGVLLVDRMVFFDAVPPERCWNCWPLVPAFSFASKRWGHAEVGALSPVAWEDAAWDALVLPARRKALIRAVVQKQRDVGSVDVIAGKGEGTTFLLYGPPGTGKTLTAEAMAEALHKPLYVLSAGEMGTTPQELEATLADALRLCSRWDCLCLIDEADIFLEQRSGSDILRNALVCVMLRQLEYHPGVLFLTTTKVRGIDAAIQSRLTLALKYAPLDERGRAEIWAGLLARLGLSGPFDCAALARTATNGRQIKNCVRLAMALALDEGVALSQRMLEDTLQIVHSFQCDLAEPV